MIGDTILFERTRLGLTQEKLSDYLHLTKATISKWENNQAKPDIDYLILMAKLFDMTLDELVGFQKTLTDSKRGHLFEQLRGQIDQQNGTEFFHNIQDLAKHYINDNKTLLLLVQLVLSNPAQIDSNPWSLELINRIISKTTVESELQSAIMLKVVILFQQKNTMILSHFIRIVLINLVRSYFWPIASLLRGKQGKQNKSYKLKFTSKFC